MIRFLNEGSISTSTVLSNRKVFRDNVMRIEKGKNLLLYSLFFRSFIYRTLKNIKKRRISLLLQQQ